jgi:hypothetical protein
LLGKPVLNGDIFSLNPAKLAQFLPECVEENGNTRCCAIIEEPYAKDFSRLLRPWYSWQKDSEQQANKNDESSAHIRFLLLTASCSLLTVIL